MKRSLISILFFPMAIVAQERTISLPKAVELAVQHYPLIKQRELIKQTNSYSIGNLSNGFLPQFSLSAQATYQSAVTGVEIPVQGISFSTVSKDQYKILADINQLIFDGGVIKSQKQVQQLNADMEQQKVEVELYRLKEKINQLFLGVLYLDEQMKQVDLVKADLEQGIKKVSAQVDNGVLLKSNLNVLKAELLKAEQRKIELVATRKGLLDVLGIYINESLPADTRLEKPVPSVPTLSKEIDRPELQLLSSQEKLLGGQVSLIDARNKPKAGLFFEGGYGKPGLNYLKNEAAFFYLTGLRVQWLFGGLYNQKKEKQIVELNQQSLQLQKETFLLHTSTQLKQQQSEIDKLLQLIGTDYEIIGLRNKVKEAASVQLENGVITANDYLREVTAEDMARQSLITHQVQLLQAQINYQTISGK